MFRIKTLIGFLYTLAFMSCCDYEQTIMHYDTGNCELYISNDSNERYIKRFELTFSDSLQLNYPNSLDTIRRSKVNIAEYFNISPDVLRNNEIDLYIRAGVKTTRNAFDVCNEKIYVSEGDSVYTFVCLGR